MAILLLLVQERGRVVSRQEIADHVWGQGVTLDVDNSINGAIRKIRRVLRDDAEQPRYIQTQTGRGYRFIAAVTAGGAGDEDAGASVPRMKAGEEAGAHRRAWMRPATAAALALLALGGAWIWRRQTARPASAALVRLAVLPFRNLTGDPDQDYFSDGFTEELITQLGGMEPERLAVIAPTSVMEYREGTVSLPQIGRELGVTYALEGGVRRDAQHVRITAQLIEVRGQVHLWAREYDRPPEDLLMIQSEIAQEIADEIRIVLDQRRPTASERQPPMTARETEAWDPYLRGRYLWSKRTPAGFEGAVEWFQRAVAADPNFAPAYAGLADSWSLMSTYGYVPASVYMPQARAAALRALQLDGSLAEAHASLALIAETYDWDWRTAEREFRRAIELNGNYATAHHWFAEYLAYEGRFDEALRESERARQLDPLSLIIVADNGAILYFARRYDLAIAKFQSVLDADPTFGRAYLIIEAYAQQGRYGEALACLRNWRRRGDGPWIWAMEAYVYGRSGDRARALKALHRVEDAGRASRADAVALLSVAYAGAGERDQWIATLQQACRERSSLATTFKVDPIFDPLRSDPRFQEMVRESGLAQ